MMKKKHDKNIRRISAGVFAALALVLAACPNPAEDDPPGAPPKLPKTWTAVTQEEAPGIESTRNPIRGVAFGNNRFVAAGGGTFEGGGFKASTYWSDDGIQWHITDQNNATEVFAADNMHVFFGGGWFIAHPSSSGNNHWGKSKDGVTWEVIGNADAWASAGKLPDDSPYINGKGGVYANANGAGYWIITGSGGRLSWSKDLTEWTRVPGAATTFDNPGGGPRTFINAVAYGKGKFVAGGGSGHVAYATTPSGTWTTTPKDPRSLINHTDSSKPEYWSNGGEVVETIFDNWFINGLVYGEEVGRFVAVGGLDSGGNGKAAYSDDGITWYQSDELGTVGFGCKMTAVAYGDGVFVCTDTNGGAAYSTDGITWTPINDTKFNTATSGKTIEAICYGNGKWIFVGTTGRIAYSIPE